MITGLEKLQEIKMMSCVVKSCAVKNAEGAEIGRIKFTQKVQLLSVEGDKAFVVVTIKHKRKGEKDINYTGYVPVIALTTETVRDFAGLYYFNNTDGAIPVFKRYGVNQVVGKILAGELVKLYAVVQDYALTSKGWTMFKWLEKDRDIFDEGVARDLISAIVYQAVHEYTSLIRKLQMRRYSTSEEFRSIVDDVESIRKWFGDENKENSKLGILDAHLEISRDWMNSVFERRDRMVGKGLARKR